jgi:YjbE family integral membrane protein
MLCVPGFDLVQQHGGPQRRSSSAALRTNAGTGTEEFSVESLTEGALTVAQIVFVNAILSGDNALVIALTAQRLPAGLRNKAILWGSVLAVFLQIALAVVIGRLLDIPGLRLAGAVALVLIARKLIGDAREEARQTRSAQSVPGAILTILIANLAMSLDNVIAVGSLSRGVPAFIAVGIGVSAVILLAAGSLIIALIERYRWATVAGAGLLACTAAGMICDEPLLAGAAGLSTEEAVSELPGSTPVTEQATIVAHGTSELNLASTGVAPLVLSRRWSLVVYGLSLSLCFGNLPWRDAMRSFDREREASIAEAEPIPEMAENWPEGLCRPHYRSNSLCNPPSSSVSSVS